MGNLLCRAWRLALRVAALGWLLVMAPIGLATTLAGLVSGAQDPIGPIGVTLVGLRVLVTALGMVLGRRLARAPEDADATPTTGALAWAIADLGTLASVLASGTLPSNRPPGDAPLVWTAHAVAAAVVVVAAARRPCAPGALARPERPG